MSRFVRRVLYITRLEPCEHIVNQLRLVAGDIMVTNPAGEGGTEGVPIGAAAVRPARPADAR